MYKILLTLFLCMNIFSLFSQSNQPGDNDPYAKQWKAVAEFEQKSLPASAAKAVDGILRAALKDKNNPEVIKALIHQGKYDLSLDAENDTSIFRNLHEMLEVSTNPVEQSVLHSMLGELYIQYYQKDQWNIDQRTELADFIPADMKEWTRGIFYNKVAEHLSASLDAQKELEATNVESYATVVMLGKDSRDFYPSMYDFLARRAIELFSQLDSDEELYREWTLETYHKLLTSLEERGMSESVLLTELDKLDYSLPSLENLWEQWKEDNLSVEIMDKMADRYLYEISQLPRQDTLQREQKTKELYDLLQEGVKRYPDYERIAILENRLLQLTQPGFSVSGDKTFYPDGDKRLKVVFKNIQSLTAKLYKLDSPVDVEMAGYGIRKNKEIKRRFVKDIPVHLPEQFPYLEGESVLDINVKEPGTYMLTFVSSPETVDLQPTDFYFAITELAVFTRSSDKDRYDFFVVDRSTGKPVSNAEIVLYKLPGNWRNSVLMRVVTLPVNEQGLAIYHKEIPNNDVFYHAVVGNDNGSLLSRLPYAHWGYTSNEEVENETVTIFTDRALYRPGQVVYYKAIGTRTKGHESQIVTGKDIEFTLRDANNRELSKQTLKTNEFGSVSGEFTLPTGALTGGFRIETNGGSAYFQVEEYKRPTFEITFDTIEQTYRFGEGVTLRGKAESFSGIKLQDAIVEYRVSRRQMGWWTWGGTTEHFTEGTTRTDNNGYFEVVFIPEKSGHQPMVRSAYAFVVEATVTDLNGETQVGSYTVPVGDISMMLSLEIADRWEKNSGEKVRVSAKNLDGNDVDAKGVYRVYSLQENDSIHRLVAQGDFETGEQPVLQKELAALPSGKYRIKLASKDDRGNPVEAQKDAVLFSYSDKRPPVKTNEWFVEKNTRFAPGKPAEVILGATSRLHVLYELWQENTLIERKWIELDNENRLFSLPYKPDYKEGVTLMLTYVKDEKFHALQSDLRPKKEDMKLGVRLDVFRDKIRPGSEEEWQITVTDAAGNPAVAEVLASMYDFSLDNIYPSPSWSLPTPSFDRYYSRMRLINDQSFLGQTARGGIWQPLKKVVPFEFDRFNWYGYSLLYSGRMLLRGASMNALQESVVIGYGQPNMDALSIAAAEEASMDMSAPSEKKQTSSLRSSETGTMDPAGEAPQIRRNFNETAFFYPRLRTNEKGETLIAFTVPESNTRWRFRVLAHDKELNSGQAEAFTVSQKELMVTPNMPRFLRHGDRTSIATKISNLSDSTVNGVVMLEFFDPVTDEAIEITMLTNPKVSFSLAPNASSDVSWLFDVPVDIDLIGVRMVASSERFSDGEQHVLSVLPNRMLVTESMRMDVKANETKTFAMEQMIHRTSPSIQDYRLTLEFTSNPVWYVVQALPVLGEPTNDNAVAWFASYYANSLGAHIGRAYPKVSAMVEAWKKQGGNEDTFLSNLEKNQELKSVLLEETPWVLDARNESEQKQKLALLFDLNRTNHLTLTAIDKLIELQTTQGGWSWFKGFHPNVGITHYILYGFNQLKGLGALTVSEDILSMQTRAIAFIDAEAIRRFDALKRYNKAWKSIQTISITDLEYLFVRTAYGERPLDKETKEMTDFYLSVLEKNWTGYGLYERSLISLLMSREGKTSVVQDILSSYREHAVRSDELGMYWANNRARVFMSQSAVSVHTFIMDAFYAGGADDKEMDEMKRWLLKQKQTQLWESAHATMDAVYALLSRGGDWFSSSGETIIHLGDQKVESDSQELGTGYFKTSWGATEMNSKMGEATVTHQGETPAWGALYWQFYEDIDKITKKDASLDIEKQLFVEEVTSSGAQLVQVTEASPLKVGDKVVVRLTLRTDRDLEFVHLKDTRAACFEPVDQVSGIGWQDGVIFYRTSKDASTNFYFDTLPRGTYVLEYSVHVNRAGEYSNGISIVQCMYAPEFTSRTAGIRINVKE